LNTIEDQLKRQQRDVSEILDVVTDLRYRAGMERIRAAYRALLIGTIFVSSAYILKPPMKMTLFEKKFPIGN
jgi:hypothetical protein